MIDKTVHYSPVGLWLALCIFAALGMGLFGCTAKEARTAEDSANAGAAPSGENFYWRIETREDGEYLLDRDGNAVPLKLYRRMAVLSPGAVETLYLLGGEDSIRAIASSSDPVWPPEKTALLPSVGNVARPSLETLISAEPDLVIGSGMNSAFIKDCAAKGRAAIIHSADSIGDILNNTLILGRLCGKTAEAEQINAGQSARLAALKDELHGKPLGLKGAFLYSVNPLMAFTGDSLAGDILAVLGAENIAAGLPAAQPILSAEYLLAQNPDFLFGAMSIRNPDDILNADSVILKTRAGREGNIGIIPSSYFLRPSPRIMEGIMELHGKIGQYRHD